MPASGQSSAEPVLFATTAMRCRFELLLSGPEIPLLRSAGTEALREIEAWDRRLNAYSPTSELSRINVEASRGSARVSAPLFDLFLGARDLWKRTAGAFDPTLGPLIRLWRGAIVSGMLPSPAEVREARSRCGMHNVVLEAQARTVEFAHPGLELNLNAMAKGHALDQAADLLREAGVSTFALHGGTSSVLVSGESPRPEGWIVGIGDPAQPGRVVHRVSLRDEGLGVSSQNLQRSDVGGRAVSHVISAESGEPVASQAIAAVAAASAASADALSTALLAAGASSAGWLLKDERALMLFPEGDGVNVMQINPNAVPGSIA